MRLHDDEIPIDSELVRRLLEAQVPELAHERLVAMESTGSSNVLYRLGEHRVVRLPRRPGGGAALHKEVRAAESLAAHLTIPTPRFEFLGRPGSEFHETWGVLRWLAGTTPPIGPDVRGTRGELVRSLAAFIRELRAVRPLREAAEDPAFDSYRGRSLVEFDAQTRRNLTQSKRLLGDRLDLERALAVWDAGLAAPPNESPRWYHGDLLAENLLIDASGLAAVLDFGCVGIGDPAIDLVGAWELFEPTDREAFRHELGVDPAEWARGRAWAVAVAAVALPYYWASLPRRRRDRCELLDRALA